ncbi:MAG: indole-3-glycerol phosphate synthase TrpC [Pyrinomonadaceae bacterium]
MSVDARTNISAELKRASPSNGLIRAGVDVVKLAREYESGGACAVSVLTEEDRFRGSLLDLRAAREAVQLPLLRKDFIFDEYQIYEAAEAGADALLLIVAALDDASLTRLRRVTEDELGMDALIEVHTRDEAKRAIVCGAKIIGVNNRDLRSFNVSLETSYKIADDLRANKAHDVLLISESGLSDETDLRDLRVHGYDGFLIGESLMRAVDAAAMLRELTKI